MAPIPNAVSQPKQRDIKNFFLKYSKPTPIPPSDGPPSPFAAFCAKPLPPRRVRPSSSDGSVKRRRASLLEKSEALLPSIESHNDAQLPTEKTERINYSRTSMQGLASGHDSPSKDVNPIEITQPTVLPGTMSIVTPPRSESPLPGVTSDIISNSRVILANGQELPTSTSGSGNGVKKSSYLPKIVKEVTPPRNRSPTVGQGDFMDAKNPSEDTISTPVTSRKIPVLISPGSRLQPITSLKAVSPSPHSNANITRPHADHEGNHSKPSSYQGHTLPKNGIDRRSLTPSLEGEHELIVLSTSNANNTPHGRSHKALQIDGIIDLTGDLTPQPPSTPISVASRKRSRTCSFSDNNVDEDDEDRPTKILRSDNLTTSDKSPNILQPVLLPDESRLETSSVLSSLSRTPSPPPKASQAMSIVGSTQGSRVFVQSSQSSENMGPEELPITPSNDSIHELESKTNSDSDSDSDSSLEDISVILARRRQLQDPTSKPTPGDNKTGKPAMSTRSQGNLHRTTLSRYGRPQPAFAPRPSTYKFSLSNLLKNSEREARVQMQVDKAKLAIFETNSNQQVSTTTVQASEEVLHRAYRDDDGEDTVAKVLHAMSRADVLQRDPIWSFFQENNSSSLHEPPPFPHIENTASALKSFEESTFREQAFLTGLAFDVFLTADVPEGVVSWLWHSAVIEPRLHLARIYVEILKAQLSRSQYTIDPERVRNAFEQMQVRPASLDISKEIEPVERFQKACGNKCSAQFIHVVGILGILAKSLPASTNTYVLEVLLRLGMDEISRTNGELMLAKQSAIAIIVKNLPEETADEMLANVAKSIYSNLHDTVLQHHLVAAIPSSCQRLQSLKRRLALAFALDDQTVLATSYSLTTSETIVPAITRAIQSDPRFSITSSTDYHALGALISLLDIGIDCGFSDKFPRPAQTTQSGPLPPPPPPPAGTPQNTLDQTQPLDARKEEADFNSTIDTLTKSIRSISSHILDSGAGHMAKTNAKAVAERVMVRFEYGVRTRPKPKRGLLEDFEDVVGARLDGGGGGGGGSGSSGKWMERWLGKRKKEEKEGGDVAEVKIEEEKEKETVVCLDD